MLMKIFVKTVVFIAGLAVVAASADIITDVVSSHKERRGFF